MSLQPIDSTQAEIAELKTMLLQMQKDFQAERNIMSERINELEAELTRLNPVQTTVQIVDSKAQNVKQNPPKTSRRRAIKKILAGAGVAGLAVSAVTKVPEAQAATNTFDFNGTSSGTGNNIAAGTTTILGNAQTSSAPLLYLNNTTSQAANATDPSQYPIGLWANSSGSFAIYATQANGNSSAIFGQTISSAQLTDALFANSVAGVTGVSSSVSGVSGLADSGAGIDGRSISNSGVSGLTKTGIGGVFGVVNPDNTNLEQGAPLRLGIRAGSNGAPTSKYQHNQGEVYLDRLSRFYVCMVGNPGTTPSPSPAANTPSLSGAVSPTNVPTWRLLAPMVVANGNPYSTIASDSQLHPAGELWLDVQTGYLYANTKPFTSDQSGIGPVLGVNGYANTYRLVSGPQFFAQTVPIGLVSTASGTPINPNPSGNPKLQGYGVFSQTAVNANKRVFTAVGTGGVPSGAKALFAFVQTFGGPTSPPTDPNVPLNARVTLWNNAANAPTNPDGSIVVTHTHVITLTVNSITTIIPLAADGTFAAATSSTLHLVISVLGYYL
ncbi:MAG TPA: hypothetical protein VH186_08020 [Chloroflexia bacterium]|nr:hypothetical protein [Chloroflexia bacterium]